MTSPKDENDFDHYFNATQRLGAELMELKAQRAMTVHRLGGEVEGAPTHAGNFLQRVDQLRAIERAAMALLSREDFWISAATLMALPGELDNLSDALLETRKEKP